VTHGLNIVAPETPTNEVTELLLHDGYVVIQDLAVSEAEAIREELIPHMDATPYGENEWLGQNTKRCGGVLRKSNGARELAIHPTVMALADHFLLPNCARYQLNVAGVIQIEPGEGGQPLHRDTALYPFRHPCPPILMGTMWAIRDFTEANGGTRLVPGSHMWKWDREPFEDEVISVEMPAGSLLIYDGSAWHGGGENKSNAVRTGLAIQYSVGWLRQEENQYLTNPPEVAREYPEELQRLIGYDFGGPFLGFVDGDDPYRVLELGYDALPRRAVHRSRPEIDAAARRMSFFPLGTEEAIPTPEREGQRVKTQLGGFEEAQQALPDP
tara:strand:- start:3518 stop:4498 length:981 start_codon:yes stop_codon:yes gene_type:complete